MWAAVESGLGGCEVGLGQLREVQGFLHAVRGVHVEAGKALGKYGRNKLGSGGVDIPSDSALTISSESLDEELAAPLDVYGDADSTSPLLRVLAFDVGTWVDHHGRVAEQAEALEGKIGTMLKTQSKALSEIAAAIKKDQIEYHELLGRVEAARKVFVDKAEALARAEGVVQAATGDPSVPPEKYAAMEKKVEKATKKRDEADAAYTSALAVFNTMKESILGAKRNKVLEDLGSWTALRVALIREAMGAIASAMYPVACPIHALHAKYDAFAGHIDGDADVTALLATAGYELPPVPDLAKEEAQISAAALGGTSIVHASFNFEREFMDLLGVSFVVEKAERRAARRVRWLERGVNSDYMPPAPENEGEENGGGGGGGGGSGGGSDSPIIQVQGDGLVTRRKKSKSRSPSTSRRGSILAGLGDKPLPSLPPLPPLPPGAGGAGGAGAAGGVGGAGAAGGAGGAGAGNSSATPDSPPQVVASSHLSLPPGSAGPSPSASPSTSGTTSPAPGAASPGGAVVGGAAAGTPPKKKKPPPKPKRRKSSSARRPPSGIFLATGARPPVIPEEG